MKCHPEDEGAKRASSGSMHLVGSPTPTIHKFDNPPISVNPHHPLVQSALCFGRTVPNADSPSHLVRSDRLLMSTSPQREAMRDFEEQVQHYGRAPVPHQFHAPL